MWLGEALVDFAAGVEHASAATITASAVAACFIAGRHSMAIDTSRPVDSHFASYT